MKRVSIFCLIGIVVGIILNIIGFLIYDDVSCLYCGIGIIIIGISIKILLHNKNIKGYREEEVEKLKKQ